MINSKQVTVVFQGGINSQLMGSGVNDGSDILYNITNTRKILPEAKIVLSTWDNIELPEIYNTVEKLGIDDLVLSCDPGGLPNIKFGYTTPNNVNRQIISSQAGLNIVTTDYVLKLRTDSYLTNDNLLNHYTYYLNQVHQNTSNIHHSTLKDDNQRTKETKDYSPIVVPNLFTIDPDVYEHMAFHISDWAQFGKTQQIQQYWSVTQMSEANATYFEIHQHDNQAKFADNAFRTRLAVEQHITTQYAQRLGYVIPSQYNQITAPILEAHKMFLAEQIIVLDMLDFGLSLPKYDWATNDEFMQINCLSHDDWYQLFYDYWQPYLKADERLRNARKRLSIKQTSAQAFKETSMNNRNRIIDRIYP